MVFLKERPDTDVARATEDLDAVVTPAPEETNTLESALTFRTLEDFTNEESASRDWLDALHEQDTTATEQLETAEADDKTVPPTASKSATTPPITATETKLAESVHLYDIFPVHKGEELRISEEGVHTKPFLAKLIKQGANSPLMASELDIAVFATTLELTKEFGFYNVNKEAQRKIELAEQKRISELLDKDELDPKERIAAVQDWLEKHKYMTRDPDAMPKNSLECVERSALMQLALQKLGHSSLKLMQGEYYAPQESIPEKRKDSHQFIYAPPQDGNGLGSIIESTESSPNDVLRKITASKTINGREFWLTAKGFLYSASGEVTQRTDVIPSR